MVEEEVCTVIAKIKERKETQGDKIFEYLVALEDWVDAMFEDHFRIVQEGNREMVDAYFEKQVNYNNTFRSFLVSSKQESKKSVKGKTKTDKRLLVGSEFSSLEWKVYQSLNEDLDSILNPYV